MDNTTINSRSVVNAADMHRDAYNAAFYELGLRWYWDVNIYRYPLPDDDEKDRIRIYLETHQPHLLKAYDANFLIDAIQATKARCYETMKAYGTEVIPSINWAEIQKVEVGV
jgi:hypothetical protein